LENRHESLRALNIIRYSGEWWEKVGESVKMDYDTLSIFKRLKGGGIPFTPCVGGFEVFCELIVKGCNKWVRWDSNPPKSSANVDRDGGLKMGRNGGS